MRDVVGWTCVGIIGFVVLAVVASFVLWMVLGVMGRLSISDNEDARIAAGVTVGLLLLAGAIWGLS